MILKFRVSVRTGPIHPYFFAKFANYIPAIMSTLLHIRDASVMPPGDFFGTEGVAAPISSARTQNARAVSENHLQVMLTPNLPTCLSIVIGTMGNGLESGHTSACVRACVHIPMHTICPYECVRAVRPGGAVRSF